MLLIIKEDTIVNFSQGIILPMRLINNGFIFHT